MLFYLYLLVLDTTTIHLHFTARGEFFVEPITGVEASYQK